MAVVPPRAPQLRRSQPAVPKTRVALPLLSVIIVNYRRWEETAALVEQLVGTNPLYRGRIEVLVVDNASPSHPLATKLRSHPQVQFVRLPQNCGFAAGVNVGFERCRGQWVLVLNPDLVVCEGFVDLICATALDMDSEPHPVGVVGFQLRNRDGSPQLSTGRFPNLGRMVAGLVRPRARRKYQQQSPNDRQVVPWVTGCCLLARRKCIAQLGGFDEDYFLYYEDVDFCRRAQQQGWAVCYEPAVKAVHLDPLQNRPLTSPMRAITRHASLTYFRKHLQGWQFWGLAQLVRAEAWFRQRLAQWRGQTTDAAICHELRGICRELMRQRPQAARQRLNTVLNLAGMR